MEIAEKGTERARELRPAASLFAAVPLPEYERNLDHAGLLRSLNGQSLKRGAATYRAGSIHQLSRHSGTTRVATNVAAVRGR